MPVHCRNTVCELGKSSKHRNTKFEKELRQTLHNKIYKYRPAKSKKRYYKICIQNTTTKTYDIILYALV